MPSAEEKSEKVKDMDDRVEAMPYMLERRKRQANERMMLAMDVMIQERPKRANKQLQSLAVMMKFLTLKTDDKLREIMQAICDDRESQIRTEGSIRVSTTIAYRTPPTLANPLPL